MKALEQPLEDAKAALKAVLGQMSAVSDKYGADVRQHLHYLKIEERPDDFLRHGSDGLLNVGSISLPALKHINGNGRPLLWYGNLFTLSPEELTLN